MPCTQTVSGGRKDYCSTLQPIFSRFSSGDFFLIPVSDTLIPTISRGKYESQNAPVSAIDQVMMGVPIAYENCFQKWFN